MSELYSYRSFVFIEWIWIFIELSIQRSIVSHHNDTTESWAYYVYHMVPCMAPWGSPLSWSILSKGRKNTCTCHSQPVQHGCIMYFQRYTSIRIRIPMLKRSTISNGAETKTRRTEKKYQEGRPKRILTNSTFSIAYEYYYLYIYIFGRWWLIDNPRAWQLPLRSLQQF